MIIPERLWFARHESKCLICMTYGILTTTEEAGTGVNGEVSMCSELGSSGTVTPEPALESLHDLAI